MGIPKLRISYSYSSVVYFLELAENCQPNESKYNLEKYLNQGVYSKYCRYPDPPYILGVSYKKNDCKNSVGYAS